MHHFFAYMARMRNIIRWGLMRNTFPENIQEHSHQTAMIAHALAVIRNARYNGNLNPDHVAALAIYHDAAEVITGDLPTPIKHFDREVEEAFEKIESMAVKKLMRMFPDDLLGEYQKYLKPDIHSEEWRVVKAADRICAYLKCVEEGKAGNSEFVRAKESILSDILSMRRPEVDDFMKEFAPSFELSLDELN